jgi:hypothetical protein
MNIAQYRQAHDTPFGSGPIALLLGRCATTMAAHRLLTGTLPDLPRIPSRKSQWY